MKRFLDRLWNLAEETHVGIVAAIVISIIFFIVMYAL
jgi:hypothetical protein